MDNTRILFPDTNFFLQCRDIRELNWGQVIVEHDVLLVVSRPVQEEIDRLKQSGSARQAKRARRTSSLFRKMLAGGDSTLVVRQQAPKVEITLPAPTRVSIPDGLDPTHTDDVLVAHAIAYQESHPGAKIALLTNDTNPALTARHHGVEYTLVPEEWLLGPEPDPRDKQIHKLEERVRRLESEKPFVEIESHADGEDLVGRAICAEISLYPSLTEDQVQLLLAEARDKHPASIALPLTPEDKPTSTHFDDYEFVQPSEEAVKRYEDHEYPSWLEALEKSLRNLARRLEYASRYLQATVWVQNKGNAPANGAVVELDATTGLVLLPTDQVDDEDSWEPRPVDLPKPPIPPRGQWKRRLTPLGQLAQNFRGLAGINMGMGSPLLRQHSDILVNSMNLRPDKDRHAFYWKPERPSEPLASWKLECAEFRHRVEPEAFELALFVDPKASAPIESACLCVRVTASNLAEPALFRQRVELTYVQHDCLEQARHLLREALSLQHGDEGPT